MGGKEGRGWTKGRGGREEGARPGPRNSEDGYSLHGCGADGETPEFLTEGLKQEMYAIFRKT